MKTISRIILPSVKWYDYKTSKLNLLLGKDGVTFSDLKTVPRDSGGIYLITRIEVKKRERPLYIGRSTNLHQRIYGNHLMGPLSNARVKKYLLADEALIEILKNDKSLAKRYIKDNCIVRWIRDAEISQGCPLKLEPIFRIRGALEGYFTGVLFPLYGISQEH